MAENGIGAIVLEGGTSMFYFTGVRWGLSERPFVAVIPAKGELAWVVPGVRGSARARADQDLGNDVRDVAGGRESLSPRRQILRDRGVATGASAIEERVRFFIVRRRAQGGAGARRSSAPIRSPPAAA